MSKVFETPFYHKTLKRAIVVFGMIFKNMQYIDDFGKQRKVPLYYAQGDSFLDLRPENNNLNGLFMAQSAPRMAFNLQSMNYAPERHTHSLHRIKTNDGISQLNRVPYDFNFVVWVRTKRFEESLQIIEQILPLFSPTFNVTANDVDGFELNNDFTITLNSVDWSDVIEGNYEDVREVLWTLQFTMKGYFYHRSETIQVIKEAITTLTPSMFESEFEQFTAEVIPRTANKNDNHKIVESVEHKTPKT